MMKLTSEEFAKRPEKWIEDTVREHETVVIEAQAGRAVMISEEDWNSINDILQVVSMSGMAESIRSGLQDEIEITAEHLEHSSAV
ncbi:MAG: type II toxin-antitoxin system Phd/YefM family antitoxin [Oceanospirillum sp.]|nr:type II toxin-antitoxin system Phd/YefM family antitoxin [Oceanospirillum sp.]